MLVGLLFEFRNLLSQAKHRRSHSGNPRPDHPNGSDDMIDIVLDSVDFQKVGVIQPRGAERNIGKKAGHPLFTMAAMPASTAI